VRTRDAFRGRRSRVVLTPRRRRQVLRSFAGPTGRGQNLNPRDDGDKRARSPGRARSKPLKPLRAGMPGYSGGPVVTMLVCFILFRTRGCGCIGRPAFPTPSQGEGSIHYSGASRRGNAESCRVTTNAPHSQSSSPGLTGRPSIPETPVMESRGRGILDRPVKPDDDSSWWGSETTKQSAVIPGRCKASNPEPRDSPMCNCTSEVWCQRTIPE
jgi:hypothetical protein